MRILIVARDFLPTTGGAQTYAHLLAEGLLQAGNTVTVLTQTPGDQEYDLRLPYPIVRQATFPKLWRLIAECDLVQFAGPVFVPLLVALLRRKPTVIEHHGYQAACPNGLLFYEPHKTACPGHFMARRYHECLRCNAVTSGWARSLQMLLLTFPRRWLCAFASMNTPISYHVQARLSLPHSKVIYYGIRDPLFTKPPGTEAHAGSSPVFAYVGRLVSEKGLPLLVEAIARLKQRGRTVQLSFVGDGPERVALEGRVANRGLQSQISFPGFLYDEAMEDAMAGVTALVMPSVWEETAGLAAMEQMMRGRVVIASDIGGLGEVVDGAGLKFPPGDVEALAACIERLIDDPALASDLGRQARERATKMFRYERMIDDHLRLYRSVLGSRA